jgi:hypothetical protein
MARKAGKAMDAAAGRKVGPRSGLAKAMFSLRPDQIEAVQAEAKRRADAAGAFRADASAVVREAIDAWMKRRR